MGYGPPRSHLVLTGNCSHVAVAGGSGRSCSGRSQGTCSTGSAYRLNMKYSLLKNIA